MVKFGKMKFYQILPNFTKIESSPDASVFVRVLEAFPAKYEQKQKQNNRSITLCSD